jgi:hypothetical protein
VNQVTYDWWSLAFWVRMITGILSKDWYPTSSAYKFCSACCFFSTVLYLTVLRLVLPLRPSPSQWPKYHTGMLCQYVNRLFPYRPQGSMKN